MINAILTHCVENKAIVDSILLPRCALPSTFSADNAFSVGKKTPSRRYAMRPIVNMLEEDRATDTRNMHKKFGTDGACGSGDICIVNGDEKPFPVIRDAAYRKHVRGGPSHGYRQHAQKLVKIASVVPGISSRQTDPQTDILITILRNRSRGLSNYVCLHIGLIIT